MRAVQHWVLLVVFGDLDCTNGGAVRGLGLEHWHLPPASWSFEGSSRRMPKCNSRAEAIPPPGTSGRPRPRAPLGVRDGTGPLGSSHIKRMSFGRSRAPQHARTGRGTRARGGLRELGKAGVVQKWISHIGIRHAPAVPAAGLGGSSQSDHRSTPTKPRNDRNRNEPQPQVTVPQCRKARWSADLAHLAAWGECTDHARR